MKEDLTVDITSTVGDYDLEPICTIFLLKCGFAGCLVVAKVIPCTEDLVDIVVCTLTEVKCECNGDFMGGIIKLRVEIRTCGTHELLCGLFRTFIERTQTFNLQHLLR